MLSPAARINTLSIDDKPLPFSSLATNLWVLTAKLLMPPQVLAQSLGQIVTLAYAVFRGPQQTVVGTSTADLQIGQLPASALSELFIVEAANGGAGPEFDVSEQSQATVRIGTWPLIASGQPVWLKLEGTNHDGSHYEKAIWSGGSSTVSASWVSQRFVAFQVTPFSELQNLKDGTALTITFKVGLAGSQSESDALTFTPHIYTVKAAVDIKPTIATVRDSMEEVPNGGTTPDVNITITGTATPSQRVEIFDNGTLSKGIADVNSVGAWSHTLSSLDAGNHSVTAKALYGSRQSSDARTFVRADVPNSVREDFQNEAVRVLPPHTWANLRYMSMWSDVELSIAQQKDALPHIAGRYLVFRVAEGTTRWCVMNWTFPVPIKSIRFGFNSRNVADCRIKWMDAAGNVIGAITPTPGVNHWIASPASSRRIAQMIVDDRFGPNYFDEIEIVYR